MAEHLHSKYITQEDFLAYAGINLSSDLKDSDNESDKVDAFLYRIEKRLETFLDAQFHQNLNSLYPEFSDYQKEHYKFALLEQALYVYKNGDISVDSGYDQEQGNVADLETLNAKRISLNAIDHLKVCGLWNTHIEARR